MSYERALEQMRGHGATAPPFRSVRERPAWRSRVAPFQWVAAAAALLAAGGFGHVTWIVFNRALASEEHFWSVFSRGPGIAALLPGLLLLASARFVLRRRFAGQMLARAIWWSNLVVGTLMAHLLSTPEYRVDGTVAALCCGTALLVVGRRGLDGSVEDAAEGAFRPTAFRGLLVLALVMAFADAQTLAFSGVLQLGIGSYAWSVLDAAREAGPTLLAALVMAVAVWGLLRLRTWALLLNLVANFVIAGLALYGHLGLAAEVAAMLAATAVVQALLPVPILALAAGGPRAEKSLFIHHGHRLATALVGVFMLSAAVGLTKTGYLYTGWLDGQGRAYVRGIRGYSLRASSDFVGADFRNRTLRRMRVTEADFTDADLSYARAGDTKLPRALFVRTRIDGTSFEFADLRGSTFRDLQLVRADLRGVDLSEATFENVRFVDSDLSGVRLEGATFENVVWDDTVCPDRHLSREVGGSCDGHALRNVGGDRRVAGTYVASGEAEQALRARPKLRGALDHLLDRSSTRITISAGGSWSDWVAVRDTWLLHVEPGRFGERDHDGDVFVPRDGILVGLEFDPGDPAARLELVLPDGDRLVFRRDEG